MISIEKTKDPDAWWKKELARYRRLASCMIEESLGYFTPQAAVMAIMSHKSGEPWGCEWYSHIDSCRNPGKLWDEDYDNRIQEINHDVISSAFKKRKYYRKNKRARAIVEANIKDCDSVFASWF